MVVRRRFAEALAGSENCAWTWLSSLDFTLGIGLTGCRFQPAKLRRRRCGR